MGKKPHPETCPRCPHRFSDVGCPFYLTGKEGLVEEKPTLGGPPDTRIITGCIFDEGHLMRWISHMIAAANRPAAVLQGWRNDMVDKFEDFGRRITVTEVIKSLRPELNKLPEGQDILAIPLRADDAQQDH